MAATLYSAGVLSRADLLDVGQREVAGDQRPLHHHDRQHGTGRRTARRSGAPCAGGGGRRGGCRRPWPSRRTSPTPASSISPARPRAPFRLAASTSSDSAAAWSWSRRSAFSASYSLECLTSTRSPSERAADQLAVDDDRLALLEDPARLALVAHGHRGAVEGDRERREAVDRLHRALVDGALDAQPATRLAAVALADLVDVAVVVDGRAQELRDDHAAGDEHERQHDDRRPPATGATRRAGRWPGSCRGLRSMRHVRSAPSATAPSRRATASCPGLGLVGQLRRRAASRGAAPTRRRRRWPRT